MAYKIIEKGNRLHVHAHCCTALSAKRWIQVLAPEYVARGFFMDKTLTADSFEIEAPDGSILQTGDLKKGKP